MKFKERRRSYAIAVGILAVVLLGVIGYGRFHEAGYVTETYLAESVREKYRDISPYGYRYGEAIEALGRDEALSLHLDFDPYAVGADSWDYFYQIFQNPDLTGEVVGSAYDWDETTGTLTIAPPDYAPGCIATQGLDAATVNRYPHSQYELFDDGDGMTWGNLGTLYLARYCDEQTGEQLKEPVVSIITLRAELADTPSLRCTILEDGRPEFCWSPVENAAEYIVCTVEYSPEAGYAHLLYPVETTVQTCWTAGEAAFGRYAAANRDFDIYRISEDAWKDEGIYEYYKDAYEPGAAVKKDWAEEGDKALCVIAVSEDGTSMMSSPVLFSELAPNLPSAAAIYTEKENGFGEEYTSVERFPAYDYVTMCDGITNRRLIDYHTEEASVAPRRVGYLDESGNFVRGETSPCLTVPYVVEGTPFSYTMELPDYDEADLEEDMAFLEAREAQLRRKAGGRPLTASQRAQGEEQAEAAKKVRRTEDVDIFANSALAEYLAVNMLGGVTVIDLSAFPEAKNLSLAEDALMEAYYQNPLILGVRDYRIDRDRMLAYVAYDDDSAAQAKKQREIQAKVKEIVPQIVTPDMTETEIEMAVNQYLCDAIVYDEDAADAYTAYGALIDGRCVCSGYAAAFRLLAAEAGLESIVVTGILDGGLSHAWNKVKIDGEWQIVDVTNNDTDYVSNALLNLPEYAGRRILTEDRQYMADMRIAAYQGAGERYEYYHVTERFYPTEEIAARLAEDLRADGEAALRTDYDLNDERFHAITDAVYTSLDSGEELYGFYWLGVIYLRTGRF